MAKGNWRDSLDRRLINVLKKEGTSEFLSLATAMLSVDARGNPQFKAQFVGEVCECVFDGLTKKYLAATGHTATLFHSAVLKDLRNPSSDFRTELDFVLVSPYFILTTECKSYSGEVTITKECTLEHRNACSDVWKQSKLHYDKLQLYAKQLALPTAQVAALPVFANVFLFSNSEVHDKRVNRNALRVNTASNLFEFYNAMFAKYTSEVFDYDRACKVLRVCAASKKLHAQHGAYVGYSD